MDQVLEVGWVESKVFGVHVAGSGIGGLEGRGDVGDMEVDVVSEAVGSKVGCNVLEWGFTAALVAYVGDGDGGVHPEEDCVVGYVVGEGLDSEEGREEFEGVNVVLLGDGPVVQ